MTTRRHSELSTTHPAAAEAYPAGVDVSLMTRALQRVLNRAGNGLTIYVRPVRAAIMEKMAQIVSDRTAFEPEQALESVLQAAGTSLANYSRSATLVDEFKLALQEYDALLGQGLTDQQLLLRTIGQVRANDLSVEAIWRMLSLPERQALAADLPAAIQVDPLQLSFFNLQDVSPLLQDRLSALVAEEAQSWALSQAHTDAVDAGGGRDGEASTQPVTTPTFA